MKSMEELLVGDRGRETFLRGHIRPLKDELVHLRLELEAVNERIDEVLADNISNVTDPDMDEISSSASPDEESPEEEGALFY